MNKMLQAKTFGIQTNGRFTFFSEFLKHPLQVASVIPSSRTVERRIAETAGVDSAKSIVELGPGTGGTTRAILRAMPPQAKLLSIEINPRLYELVKRIRDQRFIAHHGSAENLREIISAYGLHAPEVFISGIPFTTISRSSASKIIEAISSVLAPGGCFVAYQVSSHVASVGRPFLGAAQVEVQLFNIPPLRIYRWEKNSR
jgi:phosphatidylethanolamine/phosphatidyl-N-methylethanolamine N-methyltransferase